MPPRGRPATSRAARRAEVRDQLLPAVTDLLVDGRTYADLGINEIAAAAGIAKSTFYQYFTGKNDLLRSLLEDVTVNLGGADGWLRFDAAPTLAAVERSVAERAATYRPYLPLMAAAFDAVYIDSEVRTTAQQLQARLDDGIAAHIRRGQADGWIDPALPARDTAVWLNWMVTRGFHQLILDADDATAEPLVSELGRLVWSILYAPAAHEESR